MTLTATYEVKGGCLHVRAEGEYEPGKSRAIATESAEKARAQNLHLLMFDLRCVRGLDSSSLMERFELCTFAADCFSGGFRMAVLGMPNQITGDRFEESVMVNRGATVKVTSDLNEALDWLQATTTGTKPAGGQFFNL